MKKSTVVLISISCYLLGNVVGFLLSPAKNGFGNNCGNHIHLHIPGEKDEKSEVIKP